MPCRRRSLCNVCVASLHLSSLCCTLDAFLPCTCCCDLERLLWDYSVGLSENLAEPVVAHHGPVELPKGADPIWNEKCANTIEKKSDVNHRHHGGVSDQIVSLTKKTDLNSLIGYGMIFFWFLPLSSISNVIQVTKSSWNQSEPLDISLPWSCRGEVSIWNLPSALFSAASTLLYYISLYLGQLTTVLPNCLRYESLSSLWRNRKEKETISTAGMGKRYQCIIVDETDRKVAG